MSRLIDVSCKIADVHHRYAEIHGALFGAASFRLIIQAVRGRRGRAYREHIEALATLRTELADLELGLPELPAEGGVKTTEREIHKTLLDYQRALDRSMSDLGVIFEHLADDESAYREPGTDGRSGFTRDKLSYDHSLIELERLGTRLNRLFARY